MSRRGRKWLFVTSHASVLIQVDRDPDLTVREREILDLVARAWSNQQIAAQLGLSIKTVRNHVSSVFTKIQVVDRAHAIVKAREAGIGGRS